MTDFAELERLAREAHIGDGVAWLTISDLAPLSADDAAYIAACSPDQVLRLVAIARAAERLCFLMERDNCVLPGPEFAALRAALSPEKDRT